MMSIFPAAMELVNLEVNYNGCKFKNMHNDYINVIQMNFFNFLGT